MLGILGSSNRRARLCDSQLFELSTASNLSVFTLWRNGRSSLGAFVLPHTAINEKVMVGRYRWGRQYDGMIGYVEIAGKNWLGISTCMPRLTKPGAEQIGIYRGGDSADIREGAKVEVYFKPVESGIRGFFKEFWKAQIGTANIERIILVENGPSLTGWRKEIYWWKYFLCLEPEKVR